MRGASPPVEALCGGLFLFACGSHLGHELAGSAALAVHRPRFVPANGMTTRTGKRPPPRLGNPIMPAPQALEIRKLGHHGFRRSYPRNARLARTPRLEKFTRRQKGSSVEVQATLPGIAALPAWARRHIGGRGPAIASVRGKSGKLLLQMLLTARRALDARGVDRAADQLFKLRPTVFATVFINRHDGSFLLYY